MSDPFRRCMKCNQFVHTHFHFCPHCGWTMDLPYPAQQAPLYYAPPPRRKERWLAAVLALLLGGIGVHRFYLGDYGWGIAYVLFFWTFIPAIIALCEVVWLACMSDEAFDWRYNQPR